MPRKKLTQEEAEKRSLDVGIKMIGRYIKHNIPAEFECPICKNIFKTTPNAIFTQKTLSCGCLRRKPKSGNSLAEKFPLITKEWHPTKNNDTPFDVNYSCNDKRWWVCPHKHIYQTTINRRTCKGCSCPICNGKKILFGYNDLQTLYPNIAQEWDYKKNQITPQEVASKSNKKAWWICPNNHNYESSIASRTNLNTGCPYCANQKILINYNDVYTTHKDLINKEWDFIKNNISPTEVFAGSKNKIWWKCILDHSYQMALNDKISKKLGCPYCSGKRTLTGYNDLCTTYPQLISEWDYVKNTIKPTDICQGSEKRVWWICNKCHYSWVTFVYSRTGGLSGCPKCNESHGEKRIAEILDRNSIYYIKEYKFNNCRHINRLRFDFYLPQHNCLIEFNGIQHYQTTTTYIPTSTMLKDLQKKDSIKKLFCKESNIKLIVIPYTQLHNIESIIIKELNIKQ